eukprot:CAMPEP_0206234910 /NCGR_PEP_ID=MMETSP0047_2-20121206/12852_1 /ASSEMBLY_ACC=CAM_ASM_000192 /TAXON_ID=195065 /ORGANISM="Chroomonas mesostigmatica_cf, Strain CCMP1168" /LENGTH=99 /DNA_ID=CAMNT_0053659047 /DNA_START=40 /DNA_END=339 /DNA_ORIENTATION=+
MQVPELNVEEELRESCLCSRHNLCPCVLRRHHLLEHSALEELLNHLVSLLLLLTHHHPTPLRRSRVREHKPLPHALHEEVRELRHVLLAPDVHRLTIRA